MSAAKPPASPGRVSLWQRLLGWFRGLIPSPRSAARPLMSCTHRWPDGTSAWADCKYRDGAWWSACRRCGLIARCT